MSSVVFLVALAAVPAGLAVMNAVQRRRPGSVVARYSWAIKAACVAPYLAGGVWNYLHGDKVAGGLFAAAGCALALLAGVELAVSRLKGPFLGE